MSARGSSDDAEVSPRFGVFLPLFTRPAAEVMKRAAMADELGFDTIWLNDHLCGPDEAYDVDTLEGWTLAGAVAARTSRARIGHMVTCSQLRHPGLLAKMAVTLDHLSGGRLDLGLGWGGTVPGEFQRFGIDEPRRVRSERLQETLEILSRMFAGERFDFDGRYWTLRGAIGRPRPVQESIPVHIGGVGPTLTLPLVRRYADWWNCPGEETHRLSELIPLVGDARVSAQHGIALAEDASRREEAEKGAKEAFGDWSGVVVGTPDKVADALRRDLELGVEAFVLLFCDFGAGSLDLFAREVMPRLRERAR